MFWKYIFENWGTILSNIFDKKFKDALIIMNSYDLNGINIEFTIGRINKQQVIPYCENSHIEIYLVPKLKSDIKEMIYLYKTRINLPNMSVSCFKPYINNDIPANILSRYDIKLTDFMFQSSICYKENKHCMCIVILVKEEKSFFLEQKLIKFETNTERKIWMQKEPIIDEMLYNIIGQYHLFIHVAYIEILVLKNQESKDIQTTNVENENKLTDGNIKLTDGNIKLTDGNIKLIDEEIDKKSITADNDNANKMSSMLPNIYLYANSDENFSPMCRLKDSMKLLMKSSYKKFMFECNYCSHNNYQVDLKRCACQAVYYCSIICQKADRENHSLVCKIVKTDYKVDKL